MNSNRELSKSEFDLLFLQGKIKDAGIGNARAPKFFRLYFCGGEKEFQEYDQIICGRLDGKIVWTKVDSENPTGLLINKKRRDPIF